MFTPASLALMVTLATLMYEILLTRIFSVTMWYHYAFMAISIAMLGMATGAVRVFVAGFAERSEEEIRRKAQEEADDPADHHHPHGSHQHHLDDLIGIGPQGHADAQLTGAPRHGIADDAVHPDTRQ